MVTRRNKISVFLILTLCIIGSSLAYPYSGDSSLESWESINPYVFIQDLIFFKSEELNCNFFLTFSDWYDKILKEYMDYSEYPDEEFSMPKTTVAPPSYESATTSKFHISADSSEESSEEMIVVSTLGIYSGSTEVEDQEKEVDADTYFAITTVEPPNDSSDFDYYGEKSIEEIDLMDIYFGSKEEKSDEKQRSSEEVKRSSKEQNSSEKEISLEQEKSFEEHFTTTTTTEVPTTTEKPEDYLDPEDTIVDYSDPYDYFGNITQITDDYIDGGVNYDYRDVWYNIKPNTVCFILGFAFLVLSLLIYTSCRRKSQQM